MSMWDDEAGYDRDDPKHPDWADAMADRADRDRKEIRCSCGPEMMRVLCKDGRCKFCGRETA